MHSLEFVDGANQEFRVLRNLVEDIRCLQTHVAGHRELLVELRRGVVEALAVDAVATVLLEVVVEAGACLAIVVLAVAAVVVVAQAQQLVDRGQIPTLALVATPLKGGEEIGRAHV